MVGFRVVLLRISILSIVLFVLQGRLSLCSYALDLYVTFAIFIRLRVVHKYLEIFFFNVMFLFYRSTGHVFN